MKMSTAALVAIVCLSPALGVAADPKPADKSSQQNRMKTCNADAKAKSLKGDERKTFMSECLKAK